MSVECSFPGCKSKFDDERHMKEHKHRSLDHYYCKKCDYDALDWNDMLEHKIQAMVPFLVGNQKASKHNKMKHLCCEFCGEDFKSLEGRLLHRNQMHQAPQHITCQGEGTFYNLATNQTEHGHCGKVFIRGSDFIAHLEQGDCDYITAEQFHAERQYRHVIKQILVNPAEFAANMKASKAFKETDKMTETSAWSARPSNQLMDQDDTMSEASGYKALLPKAAALNLIDQSIDQRLAPPTTATDRHGLMRPMHMCYKTSAFSVTNANSVSGRSVATMPHSSGSSEPSPIKSLLSSPDTASQAESASSQSTLRAEWRQVLPSSGPHTLGYATSENLTKWIHTLPEVLDKPIDFEFLRASHQSPDRALTERDHSEDAVHQICSRWYDPSQELYDPEIFFHSLVEKYVCPFARCGASFEDIDGIQDHIQTTHVVPPNRCPACNAKFVTVAGMVCHFEASIRGSRCFIADWAGLKHLLSDATGGFLIIERAGGAKSTSPDTSRDDVSTRSTQGSVIGPMRKRNVLDGYAVDPWGKPVRVDKRHGVSTVEFQGRGLGVINSAAPSIKALEDGAMSAWSGDSDLHVAEVMEAREERLRIGQRQRDQTVEW